MIDTIRRYPFTVAALLVMLCLVVYSLLQIESEKDKCEERGGVYLRRANACIPDWSRHER